MNHKTISKCGFDFFLKDLTVFPNYRIGIKKNVLEFHPPLFFYFFLSIELKKFQQTYLINKCIPFYIKQKKQYSVFLLERLCTDRSEMLFPLPC